MRSGQISSISNLEYRKAIQNLFESLVIQSTSNSLKKFHNAVNDLSRISIVVLQPTKSERFINFYFFTL